jgi:hypothetical protein
LEEDFSIVLQPTPPNTIYEKETIQELQQEELVWKPEIDFQRRQQYEWAADDLPNHSGNDVVEKDQHLEPPTEVIILHPGLVVDEDGDKKPAAKKAKGNT